MKKRSLTFKLVTGGVAAVLIPLLVIGVFAVIEASNALEALSKSQAGHVARDLANMVDLVLNEELKMVSDLSIGSSEVTAATRVAEGGAPSADAEINRLNAELSAIMKEFGNDYENVLVTNVDGIVFADGTEGSNKGVSLADREYYQVARTGQANVGEAVKSKVTGKPIVPVCAPIFSPDGKFAGTVVNLLKTDFFTDKITSVKIGNTGYPFMVDKRGLVIAHPNQKHILETNLAQIPGMENIMKQMLAQQEGVESYVFEGIDKIAGYSPVALTGWSIGVTQNAPEFMAAAHSIRNMILIVGAIFLAITVVLVLLFARGISKPIMHAVDMLNDGAEQVASASGQVSAASQSLAEGASESAASLEETSSSLEQMSAMTRQNADNATQADMLMKEANKVVEKANNSMQELTTSMQEISMSSEETSKIIKTIDEIAFQTNLLALNAAVEAARAGEAGAGFAVVADEVRNLAMRAAEAAKNTAGLIEGTVRRVKGGSELVSKTNEAFLEVAASASRVGDLVAEISAASQEQAQGIDQVNKAVAEMDKVTQQTAANAEESSSVSEEMSAQAEQMRGIVAKLVDVVGGSTHGNMRSRSVSSARTDGNKTTRLLPASFAATPMRKAIGNGGGNGQSIQVRPEKIIPMDDADFKDF